MATLQELRAQRAAIDAEIAEETRKGRAEALTQVKTLMANFGLTINDLTARGRKIGPPRGQRQPKFQNPETGQTWTGQGKRPNWLVEALNKGAKITDLLINKPGGTHAAPQAPAPVEAAAKQPAPRKGPVRKSAPAKKRR